VNSVCLSVLWATLREINVHSFIHSKLCFFMSSAVLYVFSTLNCVVTVAVCVFFNFFHEIIFIDC